jgi:hypothetical protein
LIGASGDCFLGYDVPGSTKLWEKVRTCSSTTSVALYTDASCTTLYSPQPVGNPFPVGTCLTTNLPPGVTSYKITCAPPPPPFVMTVNYFSDGSCRTPVSGSTLNGAPNPLIGASGDCFLGYDNVPGSTKLWEKVRTCSSTTSITLYTDASCTTLYSPQPVGNPYPVGTCLTTNLPPGVTSYNITCALSVSATPSKSSAVSAVPVALCVAVAALIMLWI